jgi:hypothetical protein
MTQNGMNIPTLALSSVLVIYRSGTRILVTLWREIKDLGLRCQELYNAGIQSGLFSDRFGAGSRTKISYRIQWLNAAFWSSLVLSMSLAALSTVFLSNDSRPPTSNTTKPRHLHDAQLPQPSSCPCLRRGGAIDGGRPEGEDNHGGGLGGPGETEGGGWCTRDGVVSVVSGVAGAAGAGAAPVVAVAGCRSTSSPGAVDHNELYHPQMQS